MQSSAPDYLHPLLLRCCRIRQLNVYLDFTMSSAVVVVVKSHWSLLINIYL